MKIVSQCREQARRVYYGAVFEIKKGIPIKELALVQRRNRMTPSAKDAAKQIAKLAFFLFATVVLTLTGWFFSWSQIHSPDWKGKVGIVLLLPYAAVNRVFFWFFHSEQLSPSMYHLAFSLGSLGQFLYYYAIFALVSHIAEMVRRHRGVH